MAEFVPKRYVEILLRNGDSVFLMQKDLGSQITDPRDEVKSFIAGSSGPLLEVVTDITFPTAGEKYEITKNAINGVKKTVMINQG